MMPSAPDCIAPAKLNLFLHVTGRRADGYHTLQTAFQLLDWGDRLSFRVRQDGQIVRTNEVPGVSPEGDLSVRAARRLQAWARVASGVEITVDKVLPMGGAESTVGYSCQPASVAGARPRIGRRCSLFRVWPQCVRRGGWRTVGAAQFASSVVCRCVARGYGADGRDLRK